MCSGLKRVVFIAATIAGIITMFVQMNAQVKVVIQNIMKEACNSYPIQFFCVIVVIDLIALILLAKCLCHIYNRKMHSLKKKYTTRAVTENVMNV